MDYLYIASFVLNPLKNKTKSILIVLRDDWDYPSYNNKGVTRFIISGVEKSL